MKNKGVKVRFAPSPTGFLHIGSARSAIFNYLFSKKNNGSFFLRIDDTDQMRCEKRYEDDILIGLNWLKIKFDKIIKQSERTDLYKEKIKYLLNKNLAYISKEEIQKEGQRSEVIRFKNPGGEISFKDIIRGEISFKIEELGDFVIAKDLDQPLYHLASVIDDIQLSITHIIRGEDHISNTPRQILLFKALVDELPLFAHIPLILAPDRSKLSKRYGATSISDYKNEGYLAEALFNFLATLGWSPQSADSDEEILSMTELIDLFDLKSVQKSNAIFNRDKLNWLNKEYLKKIPEDEKISIISKIFKENNLNNQEIIKKITPLIIERIHNWSELEKLIKTGEFDYFFTKPLIEKEILGEIKYLKETIEILTMINKENWTSEKIKEALWNFATEKGRKEVLWPFRYLLSGKEKSPDPFNISFILGKEETINRLKKARKTYDKNK